MNKSELVSVLVAQHDLPKGVAARVVETVLSSIAGALERGESVSLIGFGSFMVSERKARSGRNPQTGEVIQIAASKVAKFRPGKELRNRVSKGGCSKGCNSRKK